MNKKLVHTASRIAGAWRDFWTLVPDQQQQQQAEGQGGTSFSTDQSGTNASQTITTTRETVILKTLKFSGQDWTPKVYDNHRKDALIMND